MCVLNNTEEQATNETNKQKEYVKNKLGVSEEYSKNKLEAKNRRIKRNANCYKEGESTTRADHLPTNLSPLSSSSLIYAQIFTSKL